MTRIFLFLFTLMSIGFSILYFMAGQEASAMLSLFLAFGLALMGSMVDN